MFRFLSAAVAAAMLCATGVAALAAGEPTAQVLLFDSRHLDQVNKGNEVTYRFERKVSDERLLGAPFSDDIKLDVARVGDKGEREVVFKVFTGAQARDPSSWPDLTINPLLVWYLERAVATFTQLVGGSQQYVKVRIRESFKESAKVEAIKHDYKGKSIDAYRVSITPFLNDPNAPSMEGFQDSNFAIIVSNEVPGYFVELVSNFQSRVAGAPTLNESISLVGMGEAQ